MITQDDALARVQRGFWIHFAVFAAVNTGLAILNLTRNPDNPWFLWVVLGWGLGVALHGGLLYFHQPSRERMIHRMQARMETRAGIH